MFDRVAKYMFTFKITGQVGIIQNHYLIDEKVSWKITNIDWPIKVSSHKKGNK